MLEDVLSEAVSNRDVVGAGFGPVILHRRVRISLGSLRTIGVSLFLLLREGGGKSLTSLLCGIRVSVLLTRMGIVTEDAPAGTDIRALKCECPKIVGVKIPF